MEQLARLKKKYTVKVPQNIKVLYCDKKNIITFVGPIQTKSLKLKVKIFLIPSENRIAVSQVPVKGISTCDLKKSV